jgi:hypothetical protein
VPGVRSAFGRGLRVVDIDEVDRLDELAASAPNGVVSSSLSGVGAARKHLERRLSVR